MLLEILEKDKVVNSAFMADYHIKILQYHWPNIHTALLMRPLLVFKTNNRHQSLKGSITDV